MTTALRKATKDGLRLLVLDGRLMTCDRVRADRPYYSAKHRSHGMNVQIIAAPRGDPVDFGGAARPHERPDRRPRMGILRHLEIAGIITLADKGYQGVEACIVLTPYWDTTSPNPKPGQLLARQAPRTRRTRKRPAQELSNPPQAPAAQSGVAAQAPLRNIGP
ncbi:transposase family protein [Actinomadura luteofluorescens]|uniref:transposase family protein n=1 Tax=Actinomadura luteofluorescens TaxID=46163 RepID=UPI0030CF20C5